MPAFNHRMDTRNVIRRHQLSQTPVPLPQSRRERSTEVPKMPATDTQTHCPNLVTVASTSGGIGSSTLSAMLAAEMDRRSHTCALVDADFNGGGIDVLLGLEGEAGLRFESVNAPLGRIDGQALNHELPRWGRIGVLSFDPWNGTPPDAWETEAVVRALCGANHVVIADVGRVVDPLPIPDAVDGVLVLAIELSVLGVARGKTWLDGVRDDISSQRVVVVGAYPHGSPTRGIVSESEAEEYLGRSVSMGIRHDRHLHGDMLEGLGIRTMMRHNRRAVRHLADLIEPMLVRDDVDE